MTSDHLFEGFREANAHTTCKIDDCRRCARGLHHPNLLGVFDPDTGGYLPERAYAERALGDPFALVCTARWATGAFGSREEDEVCGRPAVDRFGDVAVCPHHAKRLTAWADQYVRQTEQERRADAERERTERRWDADGPSVVYYLRRADGLIKIGFSAVLHQRQLTLQREHGPLELLVKHWGDRRTEGEMHLRFDADRVTGEWFRPSPALLRWINRIRRHQTAAKGDTP